MMPVQDPVPAHQRSGWCHGWAQTLTPVAWLVITARDWFCFYFCLICDLSGGRTGHTMPNCPRPVPAASRHQELNSGLRCEMCGVCLVIGSEARADVNHIQLTLHWLPSWHNAECRKLLMQGAPEILRKLATCTLPHVTPAASCLQAPALSWSPDMWRLQQPQFLAFSLWLWGLRFSLLSPADSITLLEIKIANVS